MKYLNLRLVRFSTRQPPAKSFILILSITFLVVFVSVDSNAVQIQTYTVADGLVGPVVPIIFQDSRGVLWLGSDRGGVTRFHDNIFEPYVGNQYAEDVAAGALLGRTLQIVEDKWGHIWFLTWVPGEKLGRISRFDGASVSFITTGNSLATDQHGDIWVSDNHLLTRYVSSGFQKLPQAEPNEIVGEGLIRSTAVAVNVIFESRDGTFWLGGSEGVGEEQRGVILSFRENRWVDMDVKGDEGGDGESRIHPRAGFTRLSMSELGTVGAIEAIAEDPSGDLWFGGDNLLLRFDGKNFERILPARARAGMRRQRMPWNRSVHQRASIRIDTKGRIWFSDGRFTRRWNGSHLAPPPVPGGGLKLEDAWGNLWFTAGRDVYPYSDTLEEKIPGTLNNSLRGNKILTIFESIDGKLWFGHNNGVTVFDPVPVIRTHAVLGNSRIRTIYEDKRGYLWFSVPGGVARYHAGTGEIIPASLRLGPIQYALGPGSRPSGRGRWSAQSEIIKVFEVGEDVWFVNEPSIRRATTQYTFFRYAHGNFDHRISISIRTKVGPGGETADNNTEVLVSEAGKVWLAFGGHLFKADGIGLLHFTEKGSQRIPFQKISGSDSRTTDLQIGSSPSVITDLYRDGEGKLCLHFGNGRVKRYPQEIDRLPSITRPIASETLSLKATSLVATAFGNRWFFNAVTGKLIRWNDAEDSVPVELDGVSSSAPISVWQNSKETDETITFIFPDAIKTYHGTELMTTEEIDEIDTVNASILSQEGSLWLATSHGAMRYDGETLTTYTTKRDGFLVDNVRDVIEDSRGTIWFATRGGGSVRYDGETFYELTTKDGLAHNNISQIFESSNKDIWFATEKGATQYTPTQGGLPKCRLITLEADKTYTDFSHRLILPSRGAKILNVRGISPLREGLSYQFRLIGLDIPTWTSLSEEEFSLLSTDQGILPDTWASFSTSGLVKQPVKKGGVAQGVQNREGILRVRYTGLKAGNYSFLVKAYRKGWPYTEPPAVIDFSIPPPLWTRWRTYLPPLIFGAVFLYLLGRLFINHRHTVQLRNEMREKEKTELERIRAELNEAQNIQTGLLPIEAPAIKAFDIAGLSVPATQVGGDFYDYLTVANGRTAIAVADAAGKGLRGAMNAVLTNGMLYEVARFESEAAVILSDLNTGLAPRMYGPSFIALNLAILDEAEQRINYANGGQPYPILKRGDDIIEIENSDLPLGSMKRVTYESATFAVVEGDILIFYTDGLIEALNTETEMYGTERLKDSLSRIPASLSAEEAIQQIVEDLRGFVGEAEQYDDFTIVAVKGR